MWVSIFKIITSIIPHTIKFISHKSLKRSSIEDDIFRYIFIGFTQYDTPFLSFWNMGGNYPTTKMIKENVNSLSKSSEKKTYKILCRMEKDKKLKRMNEDETNIHNVKWSHFR